MSKHRLLLCGTYNTKMRLEIQSVSFLVDALGDSGSHRLGSMLTSCIADPDRSNPTRSRWEPVSYTHLTLPTMAVV